MPLKDFSIHGSCQKAQNIFGGHRVLAILGNDKYPDRTVHAQGFLRGFDLPVRFADAIRERFAEKRYHFLCAIWRQIGRTKFDPTLTRESFP